MMTASELKGILEAEEKQALSYVTSELSKQRRQAMDYYFGEKFGNEVDGQSTVVATEVADTVEWILPALLKIFTAGDETVRFEPQGPEDEAAAKQATEYVNWVFNRDNDGFLILHTMFKDALLQKTGVAKVYWEDKEEREDKELEGLDEDAYALVLAEAAQGTYEILSDEQTEDGLHNVKHRQVKKDGCVRVEPIPPEEFLISRDAKTIEDARMCAHRTRKTASDLIEMGFKKEIVQKLPASDGDLSTEEEISRHDDIESGAPSDDDIINSAMRRIWVTEAYILVDWDEDGIAEMRRVLYAGSGYEILENEAWDGPRPFAAVTPILMSHRFVGRSVADLVMDLQLIKSTIWRQMLDNLYLSNHPRHVISSAVNLDDYLTSRPGSAVRLKDGAMPGEGHVTPLNVDFVAGASFPMLEYIDSVRENRTGVTRYNQGVDADSLNKTASGINQIMSAAQQRIDLIARVFAETGVKQLFKLVLWQVSKYQQKARIIRLRNEWVPMDPQEWKNEFDMSINVGLGTGNRDMQIGHLTNMIAMMTQAISMQGGIQGPLITGENIFNAFSKLIEAYGFRSPEQFVTDPKNAVQPQQPKPDPAMIEAMASIEVENKKADAAIQRDQAKAQADAWIAMMKAEAEIAVAKVKAAADIEIKQITAGLDAQRKQQELETETALETAGMIAEHSLSERDQSHRHSIAKADAKLKSPE